MTSPVLAPERPVQPPESAGDGFGQDARDADRWQDALAAAALFAVDPVGLRGLVVSDGPGPVRDRWFRHLEQLLPPDRPVRRLPAATADDRLIGSIDLTATLATGRPVLQKGVLAEADGGIVVIPMAERLSSGTAARIATVLDRQEVALEREGLAERLPARIGIVAFDESAGPDEATAPCLVDRCAFLIGLGGLSLRRLPAPLPDRSALEAARARLAVQPPPAAEVIEALVITGASLGIGPVTAPLLALRAAAAAAALAGRDAVTIEDARLAVRLVLAPRARMIPEDMPEPEPDADPQPPEDHRPDTPPPDNAGPPDPPTTAEWAEILLAAARAALPEGLVNRVTGESSPRHPSRQSGGGSVGTVPTGGRPAGTRMGTPRSGARLALVDTIRAAAPWQALRRSERRRAGGDVPDDRILFHRTDFRIQRLVRRRESTIVFCVDASGSTAFHRLAEAKGAVELVLAQAYVSRTAVALVVFRGQTADLLLPPTRSLPRARSLLAKLPGGGGTPLAAGIDLAVLTALAERARGKDPLIMLLTDGRANISRDGVARRPGAQEDAMEAARHVARNRVDAIFIDTAPRPRAEGRLLAEAMAARYVALPYVDAERVRDVALTAMSQRAALSQRAASPAGDR